VSRKITGRDAFEAMKKNGFPHIRGSYGSKYGACVIGQAALNLNVPALQLDSAIGHAGINISGIPLSARIVAINDEPIDRYESPLQYRTYDQVIEKVEGLMKPIFDEVLMEIPE